MASASGPRFQPRWLRPLALVLVVCAHAAVLAALRPHFEETPLPSIIVDLVPASSPPEPPPAPAEPTPQETPQATPQEPEAAPPVAETPPPEPQTQTAEAPPQTPQPEPPKVVAPEALPLPIVKPRPPVTLKKIVEQQETKPLPKPLPKPAPKPVAAPKPAAPKPAARPTSAPAAASATRPSGNTGMSLASYASIVASALNRLKVYPPSARQAGITGSVGVSFAIGAGGRVTRSSIRSSGNGILDAAVRQMLANLQVPPPPTGVFTTSTMINFSLR
jgi:protein TonB